MASDYVWVKVADGREVLVKRSSLRRERRDRRAPVLHGLRRFSDAERWALKIQTGREMRTTADLERYFKENGSRMVEKGDNVTAALERGSGSEDAYRKQYEQVKKGKQPFGEPHIQVGYGS